jgi:archaellum component FlaC
MTTSDPNQHLEHMGEAVSDLEGAIFMHKIGDTDKAHESIRNALTRINTQVKELASLYRIDLE